MIYWFTGQPGAGKTTLAVALKRHLQAAGLKVVHLDGEFIRDLTVNRDFSEAGRIANIRMGQQLATRIALEAIEVVASFVSPYRAQREVFKAESQVEVIEVYVHTTELRGREKYFVPDYEPPLANFLDLDTTAVSVEACVERLIRARAATPPSTTD